MIQIKSQVILESNVFYMYIKVDKGHLWSLKIVLQLLEVELPYESACPSLGRLVCHVGLSVKISLKGLYLS